jgi:hypothetical protein
VDENLEVSRRIETTLSELYVFVKAARPEIPKVMGYGWPGSSSPNHGTAILKDALGRLVELPAMLCRSAKVGLVLGGYIYISRDHIC